MAKNVGAVLIIAVSCYFPVYHIGRIREEIQLARSFEITFRMFRRKLERSGITMPELIAQGQDGDAAVFFRQLQLSALTERSFREIWECALGASDFSSAIRNCLHPLGSVLGQYDREAQCEALSAAEEELHQYTNELQHRIERDRRMWFTLSVSSGMIFVMLTL